MERDYFYYVLPALLFYTMKEILFKVITWVFAIVAGLEIDNSKKQLFVN